MTTLDAGTFKRAFVLQTWVGAALGGVSGADTRCQNAASAAGLGGTYLAWIATGPADDPDTRFTKASIPYRRTDGALIANNWADLTDGNILATITRKADGSDLGYAANSFTNVAADGTAKYDGINNCDGWTSNGSGSQAHKGNSGGTDQAWTDGGLSVSPNGCSGNGNPLIYCFQQ